MWLEITDRRDVGVNLKAPAFDKNGNPNWSYDLVREIETGDIVYHYHTSRGAITASSVVSGAPWPDKLVWAAKGTASREAGIVPHLQDGWYRGLVGLTPVDSPVTRLDIFENWETLSSMRARAGSKFPFVKYGGREVRAFQAYLTAFPSGFLDVFPQLRRDAPVGRPKRLNAGGEYRSADEESSVAERDPMAVDPALVERGNRAHATTQNALAALVRELGAEPLSPVRTGSNFDVAWEIGGAYYVAEIKSLTDANEEHQLRLGLGQVLRYRQAQSNSLDRQARAVLITERAPKDGAWIELCGELKVLIDWPPFNRLRAVLSRFDLS